MKAGRKDSDGTEVPDQAAGIAALSSTILGELGGEISGKKKKKPDTAAAASAAASSRGVVGTALDADDCKKTGIESVNMDWILWGKSQKVQLAGVLASAIHYDD